MNTKLFVAILILLFTIILILSVVVATNGTQTKEMNYGKCVSNHSKEQNSCFKIVQREYNNESQALRKALRNHSANKTEIKEKQKLAREVYKNETENCKTIFKESKDLCKQHKCKNSELFNITSFKCFTPQFNESINNTNSTLQSEKHYCDENSAHVDKKSCATFYQQVCGWYNSNKPGDNRQYSVIYSNPCFACRDQKVEYWTNGSCPNR